MCVIGTVCVSTSKLLNYTCLCGCVRMYFDYLPFCGSLLLTCNVSIVLVFMVFLFFLAQ